MHLFFSTPIWASKIDDYKKINQEMLDYIFDLQKKDPEGIVKSNFSGWHSHDFDLNDDFKATYVFNNEVFNICFLCKI